MIKNISIFKKKGGKNTKNKNFNYTTLLIHNDTRDLHKLLPGTHS